MKSNHHIAYIIGAGLSRSLQLKARIPIMNDFISVMADKDNIKKDIILTTLVVFEIDNLFEYWQEGWKSLAKQLEGFLNRLALGRRLSKKEKKEFADKVEEYRNVLNTRPSENIETLMSKGSPTKRFDFAINALFCRINWNVNWNPLEAFLTRQFGLPNTIHTFISFNYDLILDRCIQKQSCVSKKCWSPQSGYGLTIEHYLDTDWLSIPDRPFDPEGKSTLTSFGNPAHVGEYIKLLKPHGSLNWLVPYEGNYRFLDKSPFLCLDSAQQITYYPPFAYDFIKPPDENQSYGTALCIVPPANKLKTEHLKNLKFLRAIREQQKEAFRTANEVYVIGWSMPETDTDQICLISTCITERDTPIEKVKVYNYRETPEYYKRVAKVFGVEISRLEIHNDGFK